MEKHIADELIHILDGMATLDVAGEDGPQSLALRAGMMTVIRKGRGTGFALRRA